MAAAIKERFKVDPELIKGRGGIFDVKVDGDLVFSKKQVGRFPTDDEILEKLANAG